MHSLIFSFISLLALTACTPTKYIDTASKHAREKSHAAIPLFSSYDRYLETRSVEAVSSGVTTAEDGRIATFFQMAVYSNPIDVVDARLLLVDVVSELLVRINKETALKNQVLFHPVSSSKIYFSLIFTDQKGEMVVDGNHLSKITLQDGAIRFYIKGDTESDLALFHQEMFGEANAIVSKTSH